MTIEPLIVLFTLGSPVFWLLLLDAEIKKVKLVHDDKINR